ncbi:MAG: hypothetical protein IPJ77_20005 [Planctomycetes bacterium]|nr:hypothetical protein [Planctomycetota bacterium]
MRSASRRGRAGQPITSAPAGTSLKTPAWPPTRAPAPISMWPLTPACPARIARGPTRVEPAMPTCAIRSAPSPTTTLCAMCTRLSILTPRPMRVAPKRPRSIAAFAPISTSSSTTTLPHCGILRQPSRVGSKPKPSEPITAPACTMQRAPTTTRSYSTTCGWSTVSSPTRTPRPRTTPGKSTARAPTMQSGPTTTFGPSAASDATRAVGSTTALAWRPNGRPSGSAKAWTTRVKAAFGSAQRRSTRSSRVRRSSFGTRTAAARVFARSPR